MSLVGVPDYVGAVAEWTNCALRWTVSLACCWAMRWVRNSDRPATQVGVPQQTTTRIKAATR
jgi:hypothetical protein